MAVADAIARVADATRRRRAAGFRVHPRLALVQVVAGLMPAYFGDRMRALLYGWAGVRSSHRAAVQSRLRLLGSAPHKAAQLAIGDHSIIGVDVTIGLDAPVTIGERVTVGPHVTIHTATHRLGPGSRRCHPAVLARPVRIGDGAWIGFGALILPGVTVGAGAVVTAGAVVAADVAPHTLVEGNPAAKVADLPLADR